MAQTLKGLKAKLKKKYGITNIEKFLESTFVFEDFIKKYHPEAWENGWNFVDDCHVVK